MISLKISTDKLMEIQARIGVIKTNAEDRPAITDECDKISVILKEVIANGTFSK